MGLSRIRTTKLYPPHCHKVRYVCLIAFCLSTTCYEKLPHPALPHLDGCLSPTEKKPSLLYESAAFSIYPDKIVQGKNEAIVLSPTHIKSNYKSPASETFSRLIAFKFSINEKDNEAPSGKDHWLVVGEEHESPVIVFGAPPTGPQPEKPANPLPANYDYTFRVDMSAVLAQFEQKGYYEAYDGSKVAKADFKGFYIAGGSEPLSWDFVNLGNKGLKLEDPDGDKIYTLTVKLNPYKADDYKDKEWQHQCGCV